MNKRNVRNVSVIDLKNKINKRGSLLSQIVVQIILIVVILSLFLAVAGNRVNSRGVHQQVLEKESALLINSAVPGMSFEIYELNANGLVKSVELKNGRIFISVDGFSSLKGYPYFSKYDVSVVEESNKFVVKVE